MRAGSAILEAVPTDNDHESSTATTADTPDAETTTAATAPSLDGRRFVMTSSTNSAVNASSPSTFHYNERDGVLWGEYYGDTVTMGRFVGTRTADDLSVSFVHVLASDGAVVAGTGDSRVENGADGIRLVETFMIGDVEHTSVCVEA